MATKKNSVSTVEEARNALVEVGRKLEKSLGGDERSLALRAVKLADKCLEFNEKELKKFMNPKTRENSLLASPTDISRTFKDAQSILSLFAGILKKTEESEMDVERDELLRRTAIALENAVSPTIVIPRNDQTTN